MMRLLALLALLLAALPAQARQVLPLEKGWRFHLGEASGAEAPGYDDAGWERVDLPHSWNRLGSYTTTRSPDTRSGQGVGWYRLALDTARLPTGRRHVLEFDGVGNIAEVWVGGRRVGGHAGAFSRFRVDVTDALGTGRAVIAVRADNRKPEPGSATADIVPLQGDFFIHGGLYRGVRLVSVAPAHIDLLDHGGPGIYATTDTVSGGVAQVSVLARLRNTAAPRPLSLTVELRDAAGRVAATSTAPVRFTGATSEARVRLTVRNPRLWNGRADPHRYTLVATLADGRTTLDRVEQKFGIRTFRVDPAEGFFLNGRHLPLHGVSRHQDWLGKGWALTPADHKRDMALIEDVGANTIRFAHYQHDDLWFELADAAGMVVWAEVPLVNRVAHADVPASVALIANARAQTIELIRQNYNRASIVTWGIGNETDLELVQGRLGPRAVPQPLLRDLNALAKAEDPGRPTVYADCCDGTPGAKPPFLLGTTGIADLAGYNRYYGWYYGHPRDLGPHLDAQHARHPTVPISVSEYGAGGATSQHSDNPEGGPIDTSGRPHPEDFQAWWHEQSWPQLAGRRWLWANWIWNMIDFSSNIRQEGDATDINDKGLVTFDRTVRKDAFFYYKANWSTEPVVHLTGRRYTDRAYPVADIRVYSNAPAVRLTLDGRDLGAVPCTGGICVKRDVALAPGANRIEASAVFGDRTARDAVGWAAPDASRGLAINVGDLAGFVDADGARVGSDHWFAGGAAKRMTRDTAAKITGAGDARLRSGYREGRFGYAIPLPTGRWRVTLTFVEPDPARPTPRRFDVAAEGAPALTGVSPTREAVERGFDVAVTDGRLDLAFSEGAVLSAIRVRPASRR